MCERVSTAFYNNCAECQLHTRNYEGTCYLCPKYRFKKLTWTPTSPLQMNSCERGDMKLGLLAVLLPALKILAMRFVLVNNAAYTTVKQNPAPNLKE